MCRTSANGSNRKIPVSSSALIAATASGRECRSGRLLVQTGAASAGGRHHRVCLRPAGHVPLRHKRIARHGLPGTEHRLHSQRYMKCGIGKRGYCSYSGVAYVCARMASYSPMSRSRNSGRKIPTTDLREQLRQCLVQMKGCFLALGNVDYGLYLMGWEVPAGRAACCRRYAGRHHCRTQAERYLGGLARERFKHLLFLDALNSARSCGSVVFLDASAIAARFPEHSTRRFSTCGIVVMGCRPMAPKRGCWGGHNGSIKLTEVLTETVETTLEALSNLLQSLIREPSLPRDRRQPAACGGLPMMTPEQAVPVPTSSAPPERLLPCWFRASEPLPAGFRFCSRCGRRPC